MRRPVATDIVARDLDIAQLPPVVRCDLLVVSPDSADVLPNLP
jgi:superfamily II DNA/RNA helicase